MNEIKGAQLKELASKTKTTKLTRETAKTTKLTRETAKTTKLTRETAKTTKLTRETTKTTKLTRETAKTTKLTRETAKLTRETAKTTKLTRETTKLVIGRKLGTAGELVVQIGKTAKTTKLVRTRKLGTAGELVVQSGTGADNGKRWEGYLSEGGNGLRQRPQGGNRGARRHGPPESGTAATTPHDSSALDLSLTGVGVRQQRPHGQGDTNSAHTE